MAGYGAIRGGMSFEGSMTSYELWAVSFELASNE